MQWYEHMEAPQEGLARRGQRAAARTPVACPVKMAVMSWSVVESASPTPEGELQLTEQLESWMRIAWKGKFAVMSPKLLLSTVWRLLPHFRGFKQQDAHEALVAIEDEWQNEMAAVRLCRDAAKSMPSNPRAGQIKTLLEAAELDMPVQLRKSDAVFRGVLESSVVCDHCQHTSMVAQPFGYVALELEAGVVKGTSQYLSFSYHDLSQRTWHIRSSRC